MTKKNGFSIIELMMAILVLAILLALTVTMGRETLEKATFTELVNHFVADFSYARALAARENRYTAITFSPDGKSYKVLMQETASDFYTFSKRRMVYTGNVKDETDLSEGEFRNRQFIKLNAPGFMINSMGIIRKYPFDPNDLNPITVDMIFFSEYSKKRITIFPSGGIKIEDQK